MGLRQSPRERMNAVGNIGSWPDRRRGDQNFSDVPLLGWTFDVIRSFDDRNVQIREIAVNVGEADFGGVLESTISLPPSLKRGHLYTPLYSIAVEIGAPLLFSPQKKEKKISI